MKKPGTITGQCLCGAIKYGIKGSLRDARSCHCSICRKAFSSASAYALVKPTDFKWLRGKGLLTSFAGKHGYGLQFCKICGSTLVGTNNGVIHGVTLGCLDDDPDIKIGKHIHVGSKAKWEKIPKGATIFEGEP